MIRKRGKSYEVRAYSPAERKNVHVGTRGSLREARALERDKEAEFARARIGRATVAQWAARWLELYPRKEATTNKHNAERVSLFAREFGDRQLTDVSRVEARAWALEHKTRLNAVRAMFNDAIDAGYLRDNPFAKLGLEQSRGRKDLVVLEDSELQDLVGAARSTLPGPYGIHFSVVVLFAATTAIRPGELFALDWERVRLDELEADIHWQERKDGRHRPKYNSVRTVVVPPAAVEALKAMPRFDGPHVFGTLRGARFARHSHYYVWDRVRAAFGRPGMDFYELRHYGATKLLELGMSAEDVAIQMGHDDGGELVRTTYGHPSHAKARDRIKQAWVADGWQEGQDSPALRAV